VGDVGIRGSCSCSCSCGCFDEAAHSQVRYTHGLREALLQSRKSPLLHRLSHHCHSFPFPSPLLPPLPSSPPLPLPRSPLVSPSRPRPLPPPLSPVGVVSTSPPFTGSCSPRGLGAPEAAPLMRSGAGGCGAGREVVGWSLGEGRRGEERVWGGLQTAP